MSEYFPIFLNLAGKDVLVIGAGPVARQKISSLLGAKAKITVIASAVPLNPKPSKKVKYIKRPFRDSDLQGRDLVFCATNDESLNRRVGRQCRERGIWVNVADRPSLCSFIMPAVVRRGDAVFAISTGGASPMAAKLFKEKIERTFGDEAGILVKILKKHRKKLLRIPMENRKNILRKVMNRMINKEKQSHGIF